MEVQYLTIDQVVDLHDEALREFGGLAGIRSGHALASSVLQVQQTIFGEDAYPTIPEKAAAYAYFIATNHPFVDGNKRTAGGALIIFLDVNGFDLSVEDGVDLDTLIRNLVQGVIDQDEFFSWVLDHARPRSDSV